MSAGKTHQTRSDGARIHAIAAVAGLSDDAYRDLLADLFDGRRSSTELTPSERARLISHLQTLVHQSAGGARRSTAGRIATLSRKQRLMWSLWQRLADAGEVHQRSMRGLEGYAKRQTSVDKLQWLTSPQEDTVIESLKLWLHRVARA